LKFTGDEQNFYDPENSYFNCVLDRRKIGNPISLSLLYLLLARRLRLPMAGIGLPGHFLCRFQSSRAEIYIDPFHGGRVLVKADCIKMVMQLQHRFDDSFLAPVSARRICSASAPVFTKFIPSKSPPTKPSACSVTWRWRWPNSLC
jgi:regulator of sirC expression with transglutaminase-like and TPR domain